MDNEANLQHVIQYNAAEYIFYDWSNTRASVTDELEWNNVVAFI